MPFHKGSRHSPEAIAKISAAMTGRVMSSEWRAKISAAATRRVLSPETRAKISDAMSGRHPAAMSAETRARISDATKGRPKTPETRAKISASLKGRPKPVAPVLGECIYCFGPAQERDHVIPRGRTGWDEPDNVVLACIPCNRSKASRTPDEWFTAD